MFVKIASALGITACCVGDEPRSRVTALYNRIMAEELPRIGIACAIVPRLETDGIANSASTEAEPVIARIRRADNAVHN